MALYHLVNGQFDLTRGSHDITHPRSPEICVMLVLVSYVAVHGGMLDGACVQYVQLLDDVMVGSEPM